MAVESGIETPTAEDLIRLDRKRKGKTLSNAEWESPTDPDARIAKLIGLTENESQNGLHQARLRMRELLAAMI